MKVNFSDCLAGFSGKFKDIVFCHSNKYGYSYIRRRVYPTLSESNRVIGSISSNLWSLEPSEAYRSDIRKYASSYNKVPKNYYVQIRSWSSLYIKLMYALERAYPEVDLRTLSRAEIYDNDLPCICVKKAVEAGLLSPVQGWEALDSQL